MIVSATAKPTPTRALLDTHAFLWAVLEPHKLSNQARALIQNPNVGLLVSAASIWEIATKYRIGKLPDAQLVVQDFQRSIAGLRAESLNITLDHASRAGSFIADHKDPFDRMLAAQAILERVPLITNDPLIRTFSGVTVFW